MRLVEQHIIGKDDPRFKGLDAAAFASKNLWNLANYYVRQSFIFEHKYLNNIEVFHLIKSSDAYKALPAKVSNQVLMQLHKAWVSFFEAMQEWREHPEKFLGRPKLPKYKHKTEGRNLLVYEKGAISKRALKRGRVSLSGLGELVKTLQKKEAVVQARVVPRGTHYVIEVVYERKEEMAEVDASLWKQEVEMGKRNNQAFVQIPHPRFIEMLRYKAQLVGITVILTEESYTSKASFLDRDQMPVYDPNDQTEYIFSGWRDGPGTGSKGAAPCIPM